MKLWIFGSIDADVFDKPENIFKRKLEKNPTHPFREVEPGLFVLGVQSPRFSIGVVMCLVTVTAVAAIYTTQPVDELIVYPVIVFVGFSVMIIYHWQKRWFILDSNDKLYEFYRGDKLVYSGHYHNIYIRLKGQNSGNGDTYYNVTLNGFETDEVAVTSPSPNHDKLAKLGRKLAHRLDINFFDYTDKSRYHVVRHRCPYAYRRSRSLTFMA